MRNGACAVVLGTEVNGLGVIRSLGRLGVPVGALQTPRRGDPVRFSRYLRQLQAVPIDATDSHLIDALTQTAARLGGRPVVVIPTTDRFSEVLAHNEDSLPEHFVACNPTRENCDVFLDKWSTAELCLRSGILIPNTVCPRSPDHLESVMESFSYPVIVKPRLTYDKAFPGKNVVAQDPGELQAFFASNPLLGRCVVQQIVPSGDGDILVVATYSNMGGQVRAIYSGRKIRQYLPDYGATCFGVSERQPDLEAATRNLLNSIGYRGFAALEFARSRADGKNYFIELNTRTYYHNQLFADAGVDLTQIGYLDMLGCDFRRLLGEPVQRQGLKWLDFRRDFLSMRLKRRVGRIALAEWIRSIVSARSFAVWNWRDPLPFAATCVYRSVQLAGAICRRIARQVTGVASASTS